VQCTAGHTVHNLGSSNLFSSGSTGMYNACVVRREEVLTNLYLSIFLHISTSPGLGMWGVRVEVEMPVKGGRGGAEGVAL
jgi:hypothetical protein